MTIIDCKKIKNRILKNIYPQHFRGKRLLAIVKEDNAANRSYLKSIQNMAGSLGLPVDVCHPNPEFVVEDIRSYVAGSPSGTCVLLLGFDSEEAKHIPAKCNKAAVGKRFLDNATSRPDVVLAVLEVLDEQGLLKNPPKRTTIIGRSRNSKSLYSALVSIGHTPTMVHTQTVDKDAILRESDLIVSFAGSPNLIKSDMVKDFATVISVGCNTLDGKLCGDIDMDSLADRDVTVTPTPGGIGPICTAVMFHTIAKWEVKAWQTKK